jgi:hypothetical protein
VGVSTSAAEPNFAAAPLPRSFRLSPRARSSAPRPSWSPVVTFGFPMIAFFSATKPADLNSVA